MASTEVRKATTALSVAVAFLAVACAGSSDDAAAPKTTAANTTSTTPTAGNTTTAAPPTSPAPTVDPGPGDLSLPTGPVVVRAAVPVAAKTIDGTLRTPDGRTRTYHLHVPNDVSAGRGAAGTGTNAVPLLVALHGGVGQGTQFERNSGFDGLAEANGFIVVYPDGVGIGSDGTDLRTWNGGDCCGQAARQKVDDVEFIRSLITRISSQYDVDATRVFATGHSNGGILAYRLACELSDQIAAIGVQSTALEVSPCRPSHPVSVLQIHGSADQNIPIGGGTGPKALSGVSFNRPIDAARTIAAADRCPSPPTRTTDARNPDVEISSWSPCASGTEVAFLQMAGASHAWMGHPTGGSGLTGPPYARLDSSLVIWNFLSQHPRR